MSKNKYYIELLNNIEKLIASSEEEAAYALIIEEMKMPYIPLMIEQKLNSFLEKLEAKNINKKTINRPDFDKIIKMILDPKIKYEVRHGLIEMLAEFNLENKVNEIRDIFANKEIELFLKRDLLKILQDQKIINDFFISYKNGVKKIKLNKLNLNDNEKINDMQSKIEKFLLNDYPLVMEISNEILKWLSFNCWIVGKKINNDMLPLLIMVSKQLNNEQLLSKLMNEVDDLNKLEKDIGEIQKLLKL